MYRFYSKHIKLLVVSADCCVMWVVLSLHSIFVLVAVFVLDLIFWAFSVSDSLFRRTDVEFLLTPRIQYQERTPPQVQE